MVLKKSIFLTTITSILLGDVMDTEQIWNDFRHRLKGFIRLRVRTEHDAEDILQDVFVKIHQNLSSLSDEERLESWLFQLTRNRIADYYRRSYALESRLPLFINDVDSSLEEADSIKELEKCILPLLQTLAEKDRRILEEVTYQAVTQQTLALKYNLSLPAMKSRIQRARKALKAKLLACCQLEFDHLGNIMNYQTRGSCSCSKPASI
jgi:RNA polymerase sigma-70 factor, ECF subfamily